MVDSPIKTVKGIFAEEYQLGCNMEYHHITKPDSGEKYWAFMESRWFACSELEKRLREIAIRFDLVLTAEGISQREYEYSIIKNELLALAGSCREKGVDEK